MAVHADIGWWAGGVPWWDLAWLVVVGLGSMLMALALRVWGGSPARSAGAVNMLDAACFIGGRYQGGDGPSLRIVRRATHRRLWAVLRVTGSMPRWST